VYADPSRLQPKGTVIFSPHADDAALSIGGMLCKRVLEEPVTLVTIFGRSNYMRESAFQNDWEIVTTRRRGEDIAFANSLGIGLRYLEFPEASLRLGSSFDKVFSNKAYATEVQYPSNFITVIKEIISHETPKFLFAPLGLGLHHDHLITNRLPHEIAPLYTQTVVFYEDLPYAAGLSESEILQHVSSVCSTLNPMYVSIDKEISDKIANLMLYKSQIGEFELNVVKYYAAHWGDGQLYERVWTAAPFEPVASRESLHA
jgi:LmbE family N-acetylglucosaminyl deacetylase